MKLSFKLILRITIDEAFLKMLILVTSTLARLF
jgi:hypothetical protein